MGQETVRRDPLGRAKEKEGNRRALLIEMSPHWRFPNFSQGSPLILHFLATTWEST